MLAPRTGSQKIDRYLRLVRRVDTPWWDSHKHDEAIRDVLALPPSVLQRHEGLTRYLDAGETDEVQDSLEP